MSPLSGRTVLITSGPTREYLDPIRFLSNRSTGRMGAALAEAARDRGARVVFVTGPAETPPPPGVEAVRVETAEEMLSAARAQAAGADLVIGVAAVTDVRPRRRAAAKVSRGDLPAALELEPTPDVVAALAASRRPGQVLVGFAAEDDRPAERARRKLAAKGLDLVVANTIAAGFGGKTNEVVLVGRDGRETPVARAPKREIAERILDAAEALLAAARTRGAA